MPATWKTVRVFISSTFSDMHAERDHLVKVVFPSLREKLEKYRIHLVDIDLRWGVTKEQADDDRALDLCLQQIDECRPFFIGILGERYGYVPQKIPELGKPEYGWVRGMTGRSITDLEIVHGVLNDHQMLSQSFFYFRDTTFLDDVPTARRSDLLSDSDESAGKQAELKQAIRNADVSVYEDYPCRFSGLKINWRLARLKLNEDDQQKLEQVASAGIVSAGVYAYLDDDLRKFIDDESVVYLDSLRLFGQAVRDQLWEAIQAQLDLPDTPPTETLAESDPLAEEADYHERFMESRLRVYVGREPIQRALLKFADSDHTVPCLVTGPSGLGKSAAMAKFVTAHEQSHQGVLVIPHFIGASPASTGLRQMLHRFCSILQREFHFTETVEREGQEPEIVPVEIPPDTNSLSSLFRQFIAQVPDDRRVLFVLDALNQLDETDNSHALNWLPWKLPAHIKLIASCIDDPDRDEAVLEVFRQRDKHKLKIEPLTDAERTAIVQQVPSLSAKTLDGEVQIGLMLANPATENPLFVLVALEELRGFGSFEYLDHRIAQFPRPHEDEPRWQRWLMDAREKAKRITDEKKRLDRLTRLDAIESRLESTHPVDDPLTTVFLQVIDRLNDEFDTNVVREVLSLLGSARSGLSRRELVDLVDGEDVEIGASRGDLFPVLRQLRPYLQRRGNLIDFFHRGLFKAVREMYLSSEEQQVTAHRRLANYFHRQLNPPDADAWSGDDSRALTELPYHQTQGKFWDDLEATLCDLRFVQAKCTAGMTFSLVQDYSVALDALPELQEERKKELQKQDRLRQYGGDLIAYAKAKGDGVPLPIPPDTRQSLASMRRTEAASANPDSVRIDNTRAARIRAFANFVSAHSHLLDHCPANTQTIAINHAADGRVFEHASDLLSSTRTPWLFRDPRPAAPVQHPHCLRTLGGHTDAVTCVALTPDGNWAVSTSADRTLRVWNINSGECLRTLFGHTDTVWDVALTPDGRTAVSASKDANLCVWDVPRGELLRTLDGHEVPVTAVALTPDGNTAVSGGHLTAPRVWDVNSGQCLSTCLSYNSSVDEIAITSNGATALIVGRTKKLGVLDLRTGNCLRILVDDMETIETETMALTPDGNRAVSGSGFPWNLHVWDVSSGELLRTIESPDDITTIAITPDGNCAVSASTDGILHVWDVNSGECLRTLEGHTKRVLSVAVTADGNRAVSASEDNTLRVWDIGEGVCQRTFERHTAHVFAVLAPDGDRAISASWDDTFRVWDLNSGECLWTLEGGEVSVTSDGRTAISFGWDSYLRVWDIDTGECLRTVAADGGFGNIVALAPDGGRAISVAAGMIIRVWDLNNGECLHTLEGHSTGTTSVAIRPHGRRAVFSSGDNTLQVWDLNEGQCLHTLEGHTNGITAVVPTPNWNWAVSASHDNTLRVWDVNSGKCLRTLAGHTDSVYSVALTPNGNRAVSASDDNTLRVWDVNSGECLHTLEGHTKRVLSVAVTPDGNRAVSASWDNTLRVWDLTTGAMIAVYPLESEGYSVAVTADDRIVVGTEVGQLHFLTLRNFKANDEAESLPGAHFCGYCHECGNSLPDGEIEQCPQCATAQSIDPVGGEFVTWRECHHCSRMTPGIGSYCIQCGGKWSNYKARM